MSGAESRQQLLDYLIWQADDGLYDDIWTLGGETFTKFVLPMMTHVLIEDGDGHKSVRTFTTEEQADKWVEEENE